MKNENYPKASGEVKIKINDNVLPGHYANQIIIMHSHDEFIMDYLAAFPPEPIVVSRIVMTPGHFKRVLTAMAENLKKYESQHGEIKMATEPVTPSGSNSLH